jgi:hypothetical protein
MNGTMLFLLNVVCPGKGVITGRHVGVGEIADEGLAPNAKNKQGYRSVKGKDHSTTIGATKLSHSVAAGTAILATRVD